MTKTAWKGALVAGAVLLASALPASAQDLTLVQTTTVGKAAPKASTQYFSAGKFRASDADSESIVDAGTGRFVVADNKKKEYWESSFDEMQAMMRQMEEQMKAAGPAMEKMMAAMGGGAPGEAKVEKGTAPRKIAGYDTEHWVVSLGTAMRYEVWAAPSLTLPARYYDAFKARYAAMGPMGRSFEKLYEAMKQVKGLPLATASTVSMGPVKTETRTEVTEVKKGALPASTFDVPAGYKKVASPFAQMKR